VASVEVTPPPPTPAPPPTPPRIAQSAATTAEVRVGDNVVFEIRASFAERTAASRAADASKALREVLAEVNPEEVRVGKEEGFAVVYAAKTPIVQLGPLDAELAGDASLDVHADAVAASVRRSLRAEQKRSEVANTIFGVSLAVFFAVMTLFLLRKVRELSSRADAWLEENPERVPAIRLRSIEVLHPAAVRSGLALAVGVGRWVGQFGLVYGWLIAAFSLFEATQGVTERLTGYFLVPLGNFTSRFATSLPLVALVLVAGLALAILLRVVGLFFEGVAEGTTSLPWLPPDLARSTSAMVRLGMVVLTLVFVAPVITGDQEGALAQSGIVAVVAVGLASVPLLATAAVGIGVVFGRRIRQGEYAEIGGRYGRVIDVSLFESILEDDDANEVRVPHLTLLLHPTTVHGVLPRVMAEIVVEPALATDELRKRLLEAAASVGADPRVDLVKLELASATFSVGATSDEADARTRLMLRANAEISAARKAESAG
jgi:small-conductance mechanosensitive channel